MKIKAFLSSFLVAAVLLGSLSFAGSAKALVRVKGYTKKSGTYVMPHYQTSPTKTKLDNYSTKGNTNPFTGKKGAINPYKIPRVSIPKTTKRK